MVPVTSGYLTGETKDPTLNAILTLVILQGYQLPSSL